MRRLRALIVCGILAAAAACAPKLAPLPTVTTPAFPDYLQPTVPPPLTASRAVESQQRAWIFLQAGDLKNAEREAGAALKADPDFYPAEVVAGYAELAQKNGRTAVTRFDRALERQRDYVPALVGKGQALVSLNRDSDAIEVFQAALAVDPTLTDIARQVEVFRFRGLERDLAAARQAARAGRNDEAQRLFHAAIAASPDSAFLYRELAAVERQQGNHAGALEHLRKAAELDPADAASVAQIAEILDAQGDTTGAIAAYEKSLSIEPNEAVEAKRDALRARAEFAKMPAEYRSIVDRPQLTRGDLAALIGVRLGPLVAGRGRDAGVITDIRAFWGEPWVLTVVRAGVMEPLPNHTFQPQAAVRRVEFAQVINRLLARVAAIAPSRANAWRDARGRFTDLAAGHIAYPAASAAVASGVLTTAGDGSFEPSRVVTGAEAIEAITRLQALATPDTRARPARR
ncbi:MAG TPA: tetratricopeptide repeat protein [Vicinamibacterales bacterium]|jgi:tetratricopeptide (TPR) repeat protein